MRLYIDLATEEDSLKIPDVSIIEASAELTYGLVHQRYILPRMGLNAMVFFEILLLHQSVCNVHRASRLKSTKGAISAYAQEYIVTHAMSFLVDELTSLDLIL